MAKLKTQQNEASVEAFLKTVENDKRRADAFQVLELMASVTQETPRMWGPSIVGFGSYHYKYESGREGDMCAVGFSPRKQALTLYLNGRYINDEARMQSLGKYKTGKGCLYINKLEDVSLTVLSDLIKDAYESKLARDA
ncbi:MAG: DUF1801 domain-containing protein [Trueperaceae bacterium]|nr:DUF1801 domain-containing protein [Trueperaceae bacterium]